MSQRTALLRRETLHQSKEAAYKDGRISGIPAVPLISLNATDHVRRSSRGGLAIAIPDAHTMPGTIPHRDRADDESCMGSSILKCIGGMLRIFPCGPCGSPRTKHGLVHEIFAATKTTAQMAALRRHTMAQDDRSQGHESPSSVGSAFIIWQQPHPFTSELVVSVIVRTKRRFLSIRRCLQVQQTYGGRS